MGSLCLANPGLPKAVQHGVKIAGLRLGLLSVKEPKQVISLWGMILLVQADGGLLCLKEKPLPAKLELLYAKGLYLIALNLAHSEQVYLPRSISRFSSSRLHVMITGYSKHNFYFLGSALPAGCKPWAQPLLNGNEGTAWQASLSC